MKSKLVYFSLIALILISIGNQPNSYLQTPDKFLKPDLAVQASNYVVTIERIYLINDFDSAESGPADVYLTVWKDELYLADFGGISSGDYQVNSNGFKQIDLDIYASTFSGTVPSMNITVRGRDYDTTSSPDELGTVEYLVPSLSEGEYHRFEGESVDNNLKIWFLTTYGASPEYPKYKSSFMLNNLYVIDDTDGTSAGDIRLEVLFNGVPQDAQFYPTASPYEWQVDTGNFQSLNYNLTDDLISENFVPYTHIIIMVWDRDVGGFPSKDYFVSLGYAELNLTSDFNYVNQPLSLTLPGDTGKAEIYITASMSLIVPFVDISAPLNNTVTNSDSILLSYQLDNFDTYSLWIDGVLNNSVSSGTILTLAEGAHNISIEVSNAIDTVRKTVFFIIDLSAPVITITSPTNTTYATTSVIVTFTLSETSSVTAFLDHDNRGIVNSGDPLSSITDGSHNLTLQAVDPAGNIGYFSLFFTTETQAPIITIFSPTNSSYGDNYVTLHYSLSEAATTTVFLDSVNLGEILSGGVITDLLEGTHNLTLQAVDTVGNIGTSMLWFTTDYQSPVISISAPTNSTYPATSVPLYYSQSESATITVFLDSVNLGFIPSGGILAGLVDDSHNVTIQAIDSAGNIGSTTLWFSSYDPSSPVIVDSFSSVGIGYEGWKNLQDCDMQEGELLILNFTIDDVGDFQSVLEIVIDSPSGPNQVLDTIGYTDLQNYEGTGIVFTYGWYVDLAAGDLEGFTQFKFHVYGNLLASVTVTGAQYHYLNTFAAGTIDLAGDPIISGSVPLEWDFFDVNYDPLFYRVYFKQNSWDYTYKDFSGFDLVYIGESSSIIFNSTEYPDQHGLLAIRISEIINNEHSISQVYYFPIYIDNENDPPVLDVPSIVQTGNLVSISYSASDFNGDSFLYSISYATDGVNFIHDLVVDTSAESYIWDTTDYPSGDKYAIRIVVTDDYGAFDYYNSSPISIIGNEQVTIVTPTESETGSNSVTVSVSLNFDGTVELFNNGISRGLQSSGYSWTIVLSKGLNTLLAVGTNSIGTQFSSSHSIRYLKLFNSVEPADAEQEDGGEIYWSVLLPLEDIGSLAFDYVLVANLSYSPIYKIQPGDTVLLESIIQYGSCTLTLTITDLSELLEFFFDPILGDYYSILQDLGITYDTISDYFEGDYPLIIDLQIGRNIVSDSILLPILEWDLEWTLKIDLVLFVQFGVSGYAEFLEDNFLRYTHYGSKSKSLTIDIDTEKRDEITLQAVYGVSLDNVIFHLSVRGDEKEFPPFGSLKAVDESGNLFESGPIPLIWVSSDTLLNEIIIGKSESAIGFEIIFVFPVFVCLIILRKSKNQD